MFHRSNSQDQSWLLTKSGRSTRETMRTGWTLKNRNFKFMNKSHILLRNILSIMRSQFNYPEISLQDKSSWKNLWNHLSSLREIILKRRNKKSQPGNLFQGFTFSKKNHWTHQGSFLQGIRIATLINKRK